MPSTSTRNAFQALAEDHQELDDETIAALNGKAKVSHRKPDCGTKLTPAPRYPDVFDQFTVRSEEDLDDLLCAHPHLAAISDTDWKFRRTLGSKPMELECGADEVLCRVDNGSTINAAWIGNHFHNTSTWLNPRQLPNEATSQPQLAETNCSTRADV